MAKKGQVFIAYSVDLKLKAMKMKEYGYINNQITEKLEITDKGFIYDKNFAYENLI